MLSVGMEFEALDGVIAVHVAGELDVSTASGFLNKLVTAHDRGCLGSHAVLDLSDVTFFGSAGVAALLTFAATCAAGDVTLRVVPTPMIRQVLRMTGAEQLLTMAKTVDDAVSGMTGNRAHTEGPAGP
ncbi:MAG TPA: STAS domain-containing protein [Pseudonocardiaceae bacterium]|nr:STAS domain-containing protein [Pseudonocardiaceae bacterium]